MTEQEWLKTPHLIWTKLLYGKKQTWASERKLRLFACACCRRIWNLISDPRFQQCVEAVEACVDGLISKGELQAVRQRVERDLKDNYSAVGVGYADPWSPTPHAPPEFPVKLAVAYAAGWMPRRKRSMEWTVICSADCACAVVKSKHRKGERRRQIKLLQDILGNPFRPVAVDPAWVVHGGGTVRKLAQAIYDDRAFDRFPILADALEEAGCADADILAHCREPRDHVRGCWALDLLLDKK